MYLNGPEDSINSTCSVGKGVKASTPSFDWSKTIWVKLSLENCAFQVTRVRTRWLLIFKLDLANVVSGQVHSMKQLKKLNKNIQKQKQIISSVTVHNLKCGISSLQRCGQIIRVGRSFIRPYSCCVNQNKEYLKQKKSGKCCFFSEQKYLQKN